jgi:Flp pilus assembly protein TadG
MMTNRRAERGQALIIIVVAVIGLIGITALAIDGGNAYAERRKAQNAVDAAALAGALARIRGEQWVDETFKMAAQNGYNNDGTSNLVRIFSPPISGSYEGNIEYIQVQLTVHTRTYFANVVGIPTITNSVEATARTKTSVYEPMLNGAAIASLAPQSDCSSDRAFWVHGEATLDISGGGVFVNSANTSCALRTEGNGSIRLEEGYGIDIVGGASVQKPKLLTPYPPTTGAVPVAYPPPFIMPKVGCAQEATISADGITMSAGWWDEEFPPPGVHKLLGGNYCLNDDFVIGGDLSGDDVTIIVEHGEVHFQSGAILNLKAPNSGDLAGLLLYLPPDNHNKVVLNAEETSAIRGTILAPGAHIRITGNDSDYGFHSQIIGYTVEADGQSNVIIVYQDDQNYDALSVPEIQLTN